MKLRIITTLKILAGALLICVLLLADSGRTMLGFRDAILANLSDIFRDPETRWLLFWFLGVYFVAFQFLRLRMTPALWRVTNPHFWLACLFSVIGILCLTDRSTPPWVLICIGGAVIGHGVALWACFEIKARKLEIGNLFWIWVISIFIALLTLTSVWNADSKSFFQYNGHARWTGVWDNPNRAGLLMGVGLVLAAGQFLHRFSVGSELKCVRESGIPSDKTEPSRLKAGRKYLLVSFLLLAMICMGYGLLRSYSRGAWVGTLCGLTYLIVHLFRFQGAAFGRWINANIIPLCVIAASVVVLSFWCFHHTQWSLMRRAFSTANMNDFSLRNRVTSWEGALQIMAEHPWFGTRWAQPKELYENYYLPPKLNDGAAIQVNDYLKLGAALGVPALFCFGMYIWLSLTQTVKAVSTKLEIQSYLLQLTCSAGSLVLLVGFWFDGGLFMLPTAATFWILLEMSAIDKLALAAPLSLGLERSRSEKAERHILR